VLVTDEGRTQDRVCLGLADRDTGARLTEVTTFDSASLTKPFFARCVLELALAGEVDLQAPIAADVDFASFGAAPDPRLKLITPAMVLAHHSGFPNWRADDEPLRLEADPGETFVYSGEGFQLLLAALRNRRSAATVLADLEHLLHRLSMHRSSFIDPPDEKLDVQRAAAHDADGNVLPRRQRMRAAAYGNLDTCLDDYVRFVTDTFWTGTASAVRGLMTQPWGSAGPEGGRTLGWGWWPRPDGATVLSQNGDNPGFKHLVLVAPGAGEAMIVLTNSDAGLAITAETAVRFRSAGDA
jgi:CubicO group peptidase (beta-lactamase class C family)